MEETRTFLNVGKIGVRFLGVWNPALQCMVADIVEDDYGNWWAARKGTIKSPMVNRPLPTVTSTGQTPSDYWKLVLNVQTIMGLLRQSVDECNEATERCSTAVNEAVMRALNAAAECDQVMSYARRMLMNDLIGEPTKMVLEYLKTISLKNKVAQKIGVTITPSICSQSALFQTNGTSISVDPSGNITVNGLGDSEVTVIPTYNTRLWQKIIIKVRQPNVRLSAAAKMRLSKNGTIRIS